MKIKAFPFVLLVAGAAAALFIYLKYDEARLLRRIIDRLSADSRVAEVIVSDVSPDPAGGLPLTTIKFLEYDTENKPLPPRYFTFKGDIIQFQSLVIRFEDALVKGGDRLKGKSAYVFMKVFSLEGPEVKVYDINESGNIPSGYEIPGENRSLQRRLWKRFWEYALDRTLARREGVKNAQIEAPGTKFVPGVLYTLVIEHDGGLRIDAKEAPPIFSTGESVR